MDVERFVPSGSTDPFWSTALAALDSDGDGRTNGQELGDPNGAWTEGAPYPAGPVTNPGNRPPEFTSSPPLTATMGLAYVYQAAATDAETNRFVFARASGPAWLSVETNGLVSGNPPDGSAGTVPVALRVRDLGTATRGFSGGSSTQAFLLSIVSSLTGWQRLNFSLPDEAALAEPLADPDRDGSPNLLEYALRTGPKTPNPYPSLPPWLTTAGQLQLGIAVRDDDPGLTVFMEVSDTLLFDPMEIVPGVRSDPSPGSGMATWLMTDSATTDTKRIRFGRIRIHLAH